MKCRDPKMGEVFEEIENRWNAFAQSYIDCFNKFQHRISQAENHPAEAARLMGLEVVEDREEPMQKTDRPHPDHILRKPRFTADEVAQAEDIRRVFGREDVIKRTDEGVLCYGHIILNGALLPSLRPGQSISFADLCTS